MWKKKQKFNFVYVPIKAKYGLEHASYFSPETTNYLKPTISNNFNVWILKHFLKLL